jgi:hypothetical protein
MSAFMATTRCRNGLRRHCAHIGRADERVSAQVLA